MYNTVSLISFCLAMILQLSVQPRVFFFHRKISRLVIMTIVPVMNNPQVI